jgi:hypothetical protein
MVEAVSVSIRNEMEQLVRDEVARARDEGGPGYDGCWCRLCEMDIVALALTLLPPLYCRDEGHGNAAGLIKAGKIFDAVQSALKRVGTWPKHRPGTRPTTAEEVALVNYTFEIGTSMVGPALSRCAAGCTCESCRFDTLAYALNRYPAKYGVTQAGRRSLHPNHLDFMRYELGMLINQAARVVSASPHH